LSSSTPSRSLHLARFCPCWAHWGGPILAAAAFLGGQRRLKAGSKAQIYPLPNPA
jgi:hypothetical protein